MKLHFTVGLLVCTISIATGQSIETMKEELPYYQIPEAPADYGPGNILARLIDGLGYRYYWATDGLRPEDLEYRPSPDAQSAGQTIDHLYGLSTTLKNAVFIAPNIRPSNMPEVGFAEKRALTLLNLKAAANQLRGATASDIEKMKLIFQRGDQSSEVPFWNNINGPIADAIYHTGQIVSFRRTTGNPMNFKVNVFQGKNRE
jgi:hypothetical protein